MNALATLSGNSVISSGGMYDGARGCPRGCPRGCLRGCPRGVSHDDSHGDTCDATSGGMYGGGRGVSHDDSHGDICDATSGGMYGGGRGVSHDDSHGVSHESRMMTRMTRVVANHDRPFHHMVEGNRGHMSVFLAGLVCSLLHDISQNVRE